MTKGKNRQNGAGRAAILIALLAGVALTLVAGFTYSHTDQPEFCGSCHVMYEATRTHQQSVHADLSCNECHAPHSAVPKMLFKSWAGTKDMYKNTFGKVGDVIQSSDRSSRVINDNCTNCHAMTGLNVDADMAKDQCIDCHRQVPHMRSTPVAERRVADE
ncbi:NapC/NirT cytochrome c domain protein [Desulfonatronospira thiodismutans ASO3-1]|uniref:Cytochrome c-type protein n=1 Tax=Desulfonatronospira thiodismutans ASO3-1 TaxID=555779 RepID=D6SLM9_9BACT|nr:MULTISPECIES: NapC/NirT family cytochrome c [Desulfonatronospira]EFI35590.1 NapC/NirT cytochrome c domain protein [Desulfonatronospira thiodismutans ASO3-1]RQD74191.1 MAG: 7-cyano-7-deazaguanine reductase [Desulfonatronospira sp. MSAO_Bac3]